MSYILEALKKSQQARDLGRVPTLETARVFEEDREPATANRWGRLAVVLAGLAVAIALYAALRPPPAPTIAWPASGDLPSFGAGPTPGAGAGADTALSASGDPSAGTPGVAPMSAPPTAGAPTAAAPVPSVAAPGLTVQDLAELILALAPRPGPVPGMPGPSGGPVPDAARGAGGDAGEGLAPSASGADGDLAAESELDPVLERELRRQLDAESTGVLDEPAPEPEPEPGFASAGPPERVPVPSDLLADIENFKQQLRREQGLPPAAARQRPAPIQGDPTRLRLTPRQQARLPGYLMTAHVHDADAEKRFVVINGLRYREGEETLEGFGVERILREGAVLSYEGNPFFVAR